MKSAFIYATAALALTAISSNAPAEEVLDNVNVVQIGTYAASTPHFVWFTAVTNECRNAVPQNPVHGFDEAAPGGKALFAALTTALVNNRKVFVRASGCTITEIYLR